MKIVTRIIEGRAKITWIPRAAKKSSSHPPRAEQENRHQPNRHRRDRQRQVDQGVQEPAAVKCVGPVPSR